MKYKPQIEVLHKIEHHIQGNEPFLSFRRAYMIVNLSAGWQGSHNFYEGSTDLGQNLASGDTLRFQMCRVRLVPMTWYERLWSWARGVK